MAMKMREMEQVAASTVQREISLGMKERHVEQLAEDYRLEIHEMKAKLTNSSFQGSKNYPRTLLNRFLSKTLARCKRNPCRGGRRACSKIRR